MENFFKTVVALVGVVLVATGLYFAISWNYAVLGPNSPALSAAAINASPSVLVSVPVVAVAPQPQPASPYNSIDTTGTIVFYVQQGQEVPYLFYDVGATMHSKALAFSNDSICVTTVLAPCNGSANTIKKLYGSGPVRVTGTVDAESILVTRIATAPSGGGI